MGGRFGALYVADVLRGEATDRVVQRGHDTSPDFGALSKRTKAEIIAWLDEMTDAGILQPEGEYRVLRLTPAAREILGGERTAALRTQRAPKSRRKKAVEAPADEDPELYEVLRRLRREIADEEGRPAFMVFSDTTLRAIAAAKPATPEQFLAVKGVGPAKLEGYGGRFLEAIKSAAR
jgi:ATP-dependent DNA helicase RecQ